MAAGVGFDELGGHANLVAHRLDAALENVIDTHQRRQRLALIAILAVTKFRWEGQEPLTPGKHTLEFDFKYDGPGMAKGGTGVLRVGRQGGCEPRHRLTPLRSS